MTDWRKCAEAAILHLQTADTTFRYETGFPSIGALVDSCAIKLAECYDRHRGKMAVYLDKENENYDLKVSEEVETSFVAAVTQPNKVHQSWLWYDHCELADVIEPFMREQFNNDNPR